MFKSNLNKMPRRGNKSEQQKMALENIKLLYESREVVINLFNDYSSSDLRLNTNQFMKN